MVFLFSFLLLKTKTPQINYKNKKTTQNNVRIMINNTTQCRNENKNTIKQCKNKEKHHKTM
jgi:hypothetical protein